MAKKNWDQPMWGGVIQIDKHVINVICDKNLNIAEFMFQDNQLKFVGIHNNWCSGDLVGILPQTNLALFFHVNKPAFKATNLENAIIELIHSVCEKTGCRSSPRLFQFRSWQHCDFGLHTLTTPPCDIVPVQATFLPCVQQMARIERQIGQLGLVCNHPNGIDKHQPIAFFSGKLLTKVKFYKGVTHEAIESQRQATPCDRVGYALSYGKSHVLDSWQVRGYASAANHSCGENANCRVECWQVHGHFFLVLVSSQKIAFNTPILFDYGEQFFLSSNQVCFGLLCPKNCYFEAVCWTEKKMLCLQMSDGNIVTMPNPPKNISELSSSKTDCHVAVARSTFFSHSCVSLFFNVTGNYYTFLHQNVL